jgi:hypothetical protein
VSGLLFLTALLVSPGHGILARVLTLRRMGRRLSGQLLLLHLQKGGAGIPLGLLERRFGWSRRQFERVLAALRRDGLVETEGEGLRLTDDGARVLESTGRVQLAHKL